MIRFLLKLGLFADVCCCFHPDSLLTRMLPTITICVVCIGQASSAPSFTTALLVKMTLKIFCCVYHNIILLNTFKVASRQVPKPVITL